MIFNKITYNSLPVSDINYETSIKTFLIGDFLLCISEIPNSVTYIIITSTFILNV